MQYGWKKGFYHFGVKAGEAVEEINSISRKTGKIDAPTLLHHASSASSALHPFFEWDDKKAAHQHRLSQARLLLRSIVIVNEESDGEPIRAFMAVAEEEDECKCYVPTMKVFSREEARAQIIRQALDELLGWTQRYKRYKELASKIAIVKKVLKA